MIIVLKPDNQGFGAGSPDQPRSDGDTIALANNDSLTLRTAGGNAGESRTYTLTDVKTGRQNCHPPSTWEREAGTSPCLISDASRRGVNFRTFQCVLVIGRPCVCCQVIGLL